MTAPSPVWCRTAAPLLLAFAASAPAAPPVLHSDPVAPASIYLDFDGHTLVNFLGETARDCRPWPDLTDAEVRETHAIVAEGFRRWRVDVTTERPADFGNAVRVVFTADPQSGDPTMVGIPAAVWGDTSGEAAYVWVRDPRYAGPIAKHEVGHMLGILQHTPGTAMGTGSWEAFDRRWPWDDAQAAKIGETLPVRGDLDGDGAVTMRDATAVYQRIGRAYDWRADVAAPFGRVDFSDLYAVYREVGR